LLNNNRQAGRRRGRGQQPRNNTGGRETGNRIDNRARGNAPQMLEKYKTLARDAQMQGDRVLTEYYLQFADHYFRVVAESRARFEETRRQRDDWREDEDADGSEGEERVGYEAGEDDEVDRPERQDRQREPQRRDPRPPRDNRPPRDDNYTARPPRDSSDDGNRNSNGRTPRYQNDRYAPDQGGELEGVSEMSTIAIDILPPAFGPAADYLEPEDSVDEAPEAPRKRRGRPRKAEAEDDGDFAA
jgi:Domain of unknown function (DUF4167)